MARTEMDVVTAKVGYGVERGREETMVALAIKLTQTSLKLPKNL
jgi:hypothetical protein